MRKEMPEHCRDLRWSTKEDGSNGLFWLESPTDPSRILKIIVSDGMGWDHVSVSLPSRCPNWIEMTHAKEVFFDDEETVIQFHPKASEYVDNHPYCLHLWRKQGQEHELPPSILTGIKPSEEAAVQ